MVALRNILIVALLALGIAFLPRGGDIADAVLAAIAMAFLAVMSYAIFVASRQNRLTIVALPDSRRFVLYSALGLIVLLVAGQAKMFGTGLGTFAWLMLLGSALAGVWLVWSEAKSL